MRRTMISCLLTSAIFPAYAVDSNQLYAELRFGIGRSEFAKSQDIDLLSSPSPGLVNGFYNQGHQSLTKQFALGVGVASKSFSGVRLRAGVEAGVLDYGSIRGDVFPFINAGSGFDRLDFYYDVKSYVLLGKLGVDYAVSNGVDVFVEALAGPAWNRLSHYREKVPTGSTASPMTSTFGSATTPDIAYGGELGVQVALSHGLSGVLSYRMLNTGHGELDTSPIQDLSDHYTTHSMISHMFTFGVRQVF